MQAPHSESSQPSFDPVSPTVSRTASSSDEPGSSSTGYVTPFTLQRCRDFHDVLPARRDGHRLAACPSDAAAIARRAITSAIARR